MSTNDFTSPPTPRIADADLDSRGTCRYDRTFQSAIEDGCLTVRQAVARGNRRAYAATLETRYELTVELALKVADNRIRLHQALRELQDDPTYKATHSDPRARSSLGAESKLVVSLVLVTAVGAIGMYARHQWDNRADAGQELHAAGLTVPGDGSAPPTDVDVRRDPSGRVTRVTGTYPEAVLAAFCRTGPPVWECATYDMLRTSPAFSPDRTGRFTLTDSPDFAWELPIHRDSLTRRWTAGDGVHPIAPTRAR